MIKVIVLDGQPDALREVFSKPFKAHEMAQAEAFARRMTSGLSARPCAQVWAGERLVREENSAARKRWFLGVVKWQRAA